MLTVKVLGSGCANCNRLEQEVREALTESGITFDLSKVTDYADIMAYNVLSTPALVMNEKLLSAGLIPKRPQIVQWAKQIESA